MTSASVVAGDHDIMPTSVIGLRLLASISATTQPVGITVRAGTMRLLTRIFDCTSYDILAMPRRAMIYAS